MNRIHYIVVNNEVIANSSDNYHVGIQSFHTIIFFPTIIYIDIWRIEYKIFLNDSE